MTEDYTGREVQPRAKKPSLTWLDSFKALESWGNGSEKAMIQGYNVTVILTGWWALYEFYGGRMPDLDELMNDLEKNLTHRSINID